MSRQLRSSRAENEADVVPVVEVEPYEPSSPHQPDRRASTQSEETLDRPRSENPIEEEAVAGNAHEVDASNGAEDDSLDTSDIAAPPSSLIMETAPDNRIKGITSVANKEGDEAPVTLTIEQMRERAARLSAQTELLKAETAFKEATQASRPEELGNESHLLTAQRFREPSIVSPAATMSTPTRNSEQTPDPTTSTESASIWKRGWKAPAIFDQDIREFGITDPKESVPRSQPPKSLPIKSYPITMYSGKDQKDLDCWAKTLGDMWKWSGDQFVGGQEQFVSYASHYLPANLKEAWGRHAMDCEGAAKRFPALIKFLQSFLGDEAQRTAASWAQWSKAKQRKNQTALEFLQYLQGLEDLLPPQNQSTLALHFYAAIHPELATSIRTSGRADKTRAEIQAAASAIEDPGLGSASGRRKRERDESPSDKGERKPHEGRGSWRGRGNRDASKGRGEREGSKDGAAKPASDKPRSKSNATPLGNGKSKTECYNCHELGHIAPNCPKPKKSRSQNAIAAKKDDEESKNEPASP